MSSIWIVEDMNFTLEAFESVEDAYNYVREQVEKDMVSDEEDREWALSELDRTYTPNGFWIEDYVYCHAIDFHPKS